MINRLDQRAADFTTRVSALCTPPPVQQLRIQRQVARIRRRMAREGDAAVLALTAELDNHHAHSLADLEVPAERLKEAVDTIPTQLKADLETAAARIRDYHRHQLPRDWEFTDSHGNRLGERFLPVDRAVIYAPGGKAVYPSSVLMGALPARLAGVREVILTTPARDGKASPVLLATAHIAQVDRVFLIGGAQAVFAFADSTTSLPQADIIVGPGNAYVTEAKRQVFGRVGIDSLAGPSEVLIISDSSTNADWVAADLLAQAEHDEQARCIVLSCDSAHLQAVEDALKEQLPAQPRHAIIRTALATRGALIGCSNLDALIALANTLAAEHVQVMTADAEAVAARIACAGGLFIGAHSCVPLGDYCAGTNHILPTNQNARFASPLGVLQFYKRCGILHATPAGAAALAAPTARLADAEGLHAHAAAAQKRAST